MHLAGDDVSTKPLSLQPPVRSLTRTVDRFGHGMSDKFAVGVGTFFFQTDLRIPWVAHNANVPEPEGNENDPGLPVT